MRKGVGLADESVREVMRLATMPNKFIQRTEVLLKKVELLRADHLAGRHLAIFAEHDRKLERARQNRNIKRYSLTHP
jgi:hypothetical protein